MQRDRRIGGALMAVVAIGLMGSQRAHADLVILAGTANVSAGGSDFVDIDLQNTGTSDSAPVDGFSVELSLSGLDSYVTFTGASMSTAATYIYSGISGDIALTINLFSSTPAPNISDFDSSPPGVVIAAGTTVGLGRLMFTVASDAPTGIAPITLTTDGTTAISDDSAIAISSILSDGKISITGISTPEPSTFVPLALLLTFFVTRRARENDRPLAKRNPALQPTAIL